MALLFTYQLKPRNYESNTTLEVFTWQRCKWFLFGGKDNFKSYYLLINKVLNIFFSNLKNIAMCTSWWTIYFLASQIVLKLALLLISYVSFINELNKFLTYVYFIFIWKPCFKLLKMLLDKELKIKVTGQII